MNYPVASQAYRRLGGSQLPWGPRYHFVASVSHSKPDFRHQ